MADLNLAKTYVPAMNLLAKGMLLCIASYFACPLGGTSGLVALVALDRLFLHSDFILDVNMCLSYMMALTLFNAYRQSAMCDCSPVPVSVAWLLFSLAHCAASFKYEAAGHAVLWTAMSLFKWKQEPLPYAIARALTYMTAVLLQVYSKVARKEQEEQLLLVLARHSVVVVAPPPLAAAAFLVSVVVSLSQKKKAEAHSVADTEAALVLREALASRKEKNSI